MVGGGLIVRALFVLFSMVDTFPKRIGAASQFVLNHVIPIMDFAEVQGNAYADLGMDTQVKTVQKLLALKDVNMELQFLHRKGVFVKKVGLVTSAMSLCVIHSVKELVLREEFAFVRLDGLESFALCVSKTQNVESMVSVLILGDVLVKRAGREFIAT